MRSDAAGRITPVRVLLFVTVWLLGALRPCVAGNDLKVGAPAPAFAMMTIEGEHLDLEDLRGKVVLLHFWATWCTPCRVEMPAIASYAARHAGAGLRVVSVSADSPDKIEAVRRLAAELHFPVALISRVSAPGYGRIWKLPVTFVIDRGGKLVVDGWKDQKTLWSEERLERLVSPLLAGEAAGSG